LILLARIFGAAAVAALILAPARADPVKIGTLYPLTGNSAPAGQAERAAIELAVEIVNAPIPSSSRCRSPTRRGSPISTAPSRRSSMSIIRATPRSASSRPCAFGASDPAKIQKALQETDLPPQQLMMGYRGVTFDETGQNTLASTYLIQLQGLD
jgi:ABC-type branched-subunit amino acid transport system substrate-binding protein